MTAQNSSRQQAFTLVELLVVIAIIGILVALLLPAVQAAREAARRTQCLTQARQLALGCMNHYDTQGFYPTGGWGWNLVGDPDRGYGPDQPGGWLFNILPFIEETALHDMGSDGDSFNITTTQLEGARQVLESPLTIITCPSRRPVAVFQLSFAVHNAARTGLNVAGRTDYAINSGTYYVEYNGGPICRTDYAPAEVYRQWFSEDREILRNPWKVNGISHQRSEVRLAQITDGTSHTILLGEKLVPTPLYETGTHAGDNETWCTGFNNDNFRGVVDHTRRSPDVAVPASDDSPNLNYSSERFGSAHGVTWHMARCDGSVAGMSFDADAQVLLNLANRMDGNTVQEQ